MQSSWSPRRQIARWITIAGVVAAMLALAACGSSNKNKTSTSQGGASTSSSSGGGASSGASASSGSQSKDPLVFAQILGSAAEGGPDFAKGVAIAAKEINAAGGVNGRMIQVKTITKGNTVDSAVGAYRSAASNKKVLTAYVEGVIGVAGIIAQAERLKLPILQQAGNAQYVDPAKPYVYSMSFDKEYPDSAVRWAVENKGAKKIGILHFNTDYSTGITKSITDRCKELGCSVTTSEQGTPDMSVDQLIPLLTKIKNSGADTYYLETIDPNVLKGARQLGMFNKPIISEQWLSVPGIVQATGKAGEGVAFAAQKCVAPELAAPGDEGAAFCTKYKKLWDAMYPGQQYALFSIYGYDAVYDFANAAKIAMKSGDVTPETMNDAYQKFDGSLRTSHGNIKTSPTQHRLVGTFDQAYLLYEIKVNGKNIKYELAPNADPKGVQP